MDILVFSRFISVVLVLLLASVQDVTSWGFLKKIGAELNRAGDRISAEANRAGDRVSAEASRFGVRVANVVDKAGTDIGDEWGRFESRAGPEISSWFHHSENVEDPDAGISSRITEPITNEARTHCHPLRDPSLDIACHFEGEPLNCSAPMPAGAVADMKCREAYVYGIYPGYNSVTCNTTFYWSKPVIKCVPDCGRTNTGARRLISHGRPVDVGEFPWHVGIYRLNSSNLYDQICGATLITTSLIVSAAHCFWDNARSKLMDKSLYKISVGKYDRDYYARDEFQEDRDLLDIVVHERYLGFKRNLAYDIAILRVTERIVLNPVVNVVCIDWQDRLEDAHLVPGSNGSIAGWGVNENNTSSDYLVSVRLPYMDFLACSDTVAAEFLKYLTHDKLCAGYVNRGTSVCPGDSGGGYVFPQSTEKGTRFYLRGIASAGQRPSGAGRKCQTEQVTAFTLVSTYRKWIEKIVYP